MKIFNLTFSFVITVFSFLITGAKGFLLSAEVCIEFNISFLLFTSLVLLIFVFIFWLSFFFPLFSIIFLNSSCGFIGLITGLARSPGIGCSFKLLSLFWFSGLVGFSEEGSWGKTWEGGWFWIEGFGAGGFLGGFTGAFKTGGGGGGGGGGGTDPPDLATTLISFDEDFFSSFIDSPSFSIGTLTSGSSGGSLISSAFFDFSFFCFCFSFLSFAFFAFSSFFILTFSHLALSFGFTGISWIKFCISGSFSSPLSGLSGSFSSSGRTSNPIALSALNCSVLKIKGIFTPFVFFSIVNLELCTDTESSSITSFLFFLDIDSINCNDISYTFCFFSVSFINTSCVSFPSFAFSDDASSLLSRDCSINLSFDKFLSWFIAFKCSTWTEEIALAKLSKFLQRDWKSSL